MRRSAALLSLLGLLAWSSQALATTELRRVETTVEVGDNTITIDRLVKLVGYAEDETVTVTLEYSGSCNVVFGALALRPTNGFTPRAVTGTVENVNGLPAPGAAAASGSATFDLTFDTLKRAGKAKQFGLAHMTLLLGVDSDCDPSTGDADGVDDTLKIPVKVFVSTASHP